MIGFSDIDSSFVGVGVYTVPQAARLLGVSQRRVLYWVRGDGDRAPATSRRLPDVEGVVAISFADLMELRFVSHFLEWGVTWPRLRRAIANVRADAALSARLLTGGRGIRFSTDGVTVFVERLAADGSAQTRDLASNQHILAPLIEQSIRRELDLDIEGLIRSWRPAPDIFPNVTVDPARAFGRPVVTPEGVPTATLSALVLAEERRGHPAPTAVARVAAAYALDAGAVRQAVAFEQWRPQRERMAA